MNIRASRRAALTAFALLGFVVGTNWTAATSNAAEIDSENANTFVEANQARQDRRHGHRKSARTVKKASDELPAPVADANAKMEGREIAYDTARAMNARTHALLDNEQGATLVQMAEADQLNEVDKAIQEPTTPPPSTVAVAPSKPAAAPKFAAEETISTWDKTSLIGKIFLAFGALLTIASAARMFMA